MSINNQQAVFNLLEPHISDNKKEKFEQVLLNRTRHVVVVLENISQAHNACAVIRSLECFGIQDVYIIENAAKFRIKGRVAMGATKWLTIHRYKTTQECYAALRERGYKIIATTLRPGAFTLEQMPIQEKFACVFGSELNGLSDYALEHADGALCITMYGFTQSFNISVTVALFAHYMTAKLHTSSVAWQLSAQEQQDVKLAWYRAAVKASAKMEKTLL